MTDDDITPLPFDHPSRQAQQRRPSAQRSGPLVIGDDVLPPDEEDDEATGPIDPAALAAARQAPPPHMQPRQHHHPHQFQQQHHAPSTQAHPPQPQHASGNPPASESFTGSFSTEELQRGAILSRAEEREKMAAQSDASGEQQAGPNRDTRIRFGIWGAAMGAIAGILLGVMNAVFEGVSPMQAQTPLIVLTFLGMASLGGCAAASPHIFEDLLDRVGIR